MPCLSLNNTNKDCIQRMNSTNKPEEYMASRKGRQYNLGGGDGGPEALGGEFF